MSDLTIEEAALTEALARDRPTIEKAVKSFMSLVCARNMTTDNDETGIMAMILSSSAAAKKNNTATSTTPQSLYSLQMARAIMKAVNAYQFPLEATTVPENTTTTTKSSASDALERSIVARLWNGLIQSEQKPSRFLGRRALIQVWPDIKKDVVPSHLPTTTSEQEDNNEALAAAVRELQMQWIEEFGQLLFQADVQNTEFDMDNDAALIWDADDGQAELARRRARRTTRAAARKDVAPS